MRSLRQYAAALALLTMAYPATPVFASSHREAPITALDHKADITDFYAFVSPANPNNVVFVMCVDPFLTPSNGPNYFPFDPDITYAINIDNNNSATPGISFQFRFNTEIRLGGVFTSYVGVGNGVPSPANAPAGLSGGAPAAGSPLIPPAITALDGPGSTGLSLRQNYTVTMVQGSTSTVLNPSGTKYFAVPSNVGPRTMPNYPALAKQGIYTTGSGIKVFAGTTDDPFFIDLGGTFDSLNLHPSTFTQSGQVPVLSSTQDASRRNFGPDSVAGFNVNTIVIEVPIAMVTRTGTLPTAADPAATIGAWATTSRPRQTVRLAPGDTAPANIDTTPIQIQRLGNPLINELIIGTGQKDLWSQSQPKDDAQFAASALDPLLARAFNAVYGIAVPPAPRVDLLPLVQYVPPIASAGTPKGPIADLLRLNLGVPQTPAGQRSRLGLLGGDPAGFPNGRRLEDDVVDIAMRVVAGVLAGPQYSGNPNNALGDGVNSNDVPFQEVFPYVAWANSGYNTGGLRQLTPVNLGSPACVLNPNSCTGN